MKKYLLFFFGLLFVVLGVIGAILPILPTTPFLLLALACFANSSPRFHQMLLHNRWFGKALQQWEDDRSISRTSKVKAMVLIVITFALSIAILHGRLQLQLGLLIMGIILLTFMWRLKETNVIKIPINDD
ncbi:MAG: YbaN family protein [Methylococcales bacterium]|nr:YbaN family protein [Methylococcales bacterium]